MSMIKSNESGNLGNAIALWRYRAKIQFKPAALVAVLLLGLVGSVPQVSGFAASGGFGWWSIGIRSFSIHIPSIRIPSYFDIGSGINLVIIRYNREQQDNNANVGINYWCKPPNYREPGAEQFRAEIDCLRRAIALRKGTSADDHLPSDRLQRILGQPSPNLRVLTRAVAEAYGVDYDSTGGLHSNGNIWLKPGHGYAYLHELLHYVYDGVIKYHHPGDMNEPNAAFWRTPFGIVLNNTYRDIFGQEHPAKKKAQVPSTPISRLKIGKCFKGYEDLLRGRSVGSSYYSLEDFGGSFNVGL